MVTFRWKEEELKMVKKFEYLGYMMKGNNSDTEHIKRIKGKANGTVGRIWSLAERKFKNTWDLRMRLFQIMVKGVILYGAENWGWKEWKEIEGVKLKYVRWTLKLNRTTPWHTIRKNTRIRKVEMDAAERAMKFEEKLSGAKTGSLERMAWEQACLDEEEKWRKQVRKESWNGKREFLESVGTSVKEWNDCIRAGWGKRAEIREKRDDRYREQTDREVMRSTYAEEVKEVLGKEGKIYGKEKVKMARNGLEIIGRFRMGNEAKANAYWRREDEKLCRACKEEPETMRHVFDGLRHHWKE